MCMVERTCIVCRQKFEKDNLIRIALNKSGELIVNDSEKADGRGAYICKNDKCINSFVKTKALNRTFKRNFNECEYEKVANFISSYK